MGLDRFGNLIRVLLPSLLPLAHMTPLVAVRLLSDDSRATFDAQREQASQKLSTHHGLEAGMVDQRYVTGSTYTGVGYRQVQISSAK